MELTTVWFVLIAVLWIGYFVLEGFDFGVGILLPVVGRNEPERRAMLRTIGPVWDGNEVWLLVAGGATFAAFPEWYATLFSGFYLALFLILVALIVRGIAIEYRNKRGDAARGATAGTCAIAVGSLRAGPAVGRRLREHRAGRADRRRQGVHGQPSSRCSTRTPCWAGSRRCSCSSPTALVSWRSRPRATCASGRARIAAGGPGRRGGRRRLPGLDAAPSGATRCRRWRRPSRRRRAGRRHLLAIPRAPRGLGVPRHAATIGLAVASLFIALFPDVMPSSTDPAFSLTRPTPPRRRTR